MRALNTSVWMPNTFLNPDRLDLIALLWNRQFVRWTLKFVHKTLDFKCSTLEHVTRCLNLYATLFLLDARR